MIVKVLGIGCTKCKTLEQRLCDLKEQHQLDIEIEKVTNINKIMAYQVMMTPVLVINDEIKSIGKVPQDKDLLKWLKEV